MNIEDLAKKIEKVLKIKLTEKPEDNIADLHSSGKPSDTFTIGDMIKKR